MCFLLEVWFENDFCLRYINHLHCLVFGQVPWMRDLIALLPQPGPIVTFQQVYNLFSSLARLLTEALRQFAGKKVAATKDKSGGIRQDILGIIVSFRSIFGRPSWLIFSSKMRAQVDLHCPNNKLPPMHLSSLWLALTPFHKGPLLSSDISLVTRRYKLGSVLKLTQFLTSETILILSN